MNRLLEYSRLELDKELARATGQFLEIASSDEYKHQNELAKLIAWSKHDILWDTFGWGVRFALGNLGYTHHFETNSPSAIAARFEFIHFFIGHEILDDGDPCIAQKAYSGEYTTYKGYTKSEYEAELIVQKELEEKIKAERESWLPDKKVSSKKWDKYFRLTDKVRDFKPVVCCSSEVTGFPCCTEDDVINCILFYVNHDLERYRWYIEDDPESNTPEDIRNPTDPILYDKPDDQTEVIRTWMLENNLRPTSI